jgi:hypothetical protein
MVQRTTLEALEGAMPARSAQSMSQSILVRELDWPHQLRKGTIARRHRRKDGVLIIIAKADPCEMWPSATMIRRVSDRGSWWWYATDMDRPVR